MAELNTGGGGGGKGGKIRTKKMSTRVDLTAMVDLAFLLITFFMLTTSLAKPKAMDLVMPDKNEDKPEDQLKVSENRTLNILLGKNNKVEWYMGRLDNIIGSAEVAGFGKNGIRKVIMDKQRSVTALTGDPKKGLVVLIKPSDKSTYRNLVDILDEMAVLNVTQYAIVDIHPLEVTNLLKRDNIY
ncbi:ExbD/TolR family protein [Hufsiella ginkgonis]|uniref:Biopolymer transporter ExbD n=1 Tax=Hufsiella ginkgonis TaxID=2695274 RepID=A0A7K1Y2Q9_9SPHI|nr:biopolymer transporter ExbD [Hufsiella ginkgonis]MXV17531.1 biopolymer transporter ExbD [Hufsiella ginkgonis]